MDLKDRQLGCFIGLAIGDALGGPYEFLLQKDYKVSGKYEEGGFFSLEKGEYTDDTSMALCLANSLIECKGFDPKDQMTKYVKWLREGYMSSRNHCFDIGSTTERALAQFITYPDNFYTKARGKARSGNAPIMRLAPISIFFDKKEDLIKYARLSSKTTHYRDIASDSSIYLAQLTSNAIKGIKKEDLDKDIDISKFDPLLIERIKRVKSENNLKCLPTGYIIDTLEVALYGLYNFDTFIEGLLYVISLGEDADTVGAIYGQLAGAYYGLESIPSYYKENLMHYEDRILKIANKLIEASKDKSIFLH